MWKDYKGVAENPKKYTFMRLKHENMPIYSIEDVKTLHTLMTLKFLFRDVTEAAYHLEVDRKTVKTCYLKNKDLYERIRHEDALLYFYGDEYRMIKAVDDSLVKKRGRKSKYTFKRVKVE